MSDIGWSCPYLARLLILSLQSDVILTFLPSVTVKRMFLYLSIRALTLIHWGKDTDTDTDEIKRCGTHLSLMFRCSHWIFKFVQWKGIEPDKKKIQICFGSQVHDKCPLCWMFRSTTHNGTIITLVMEWSRLSRHSKIKYSLFLALHRVAFTMAKLWIILYYRSKRDTDI